MMLVYALVINSITGVLGGLLGYSIFKPKTEQKAS
jgi:hypothetical protein